MWLLFIGSARLGVEEIDGSCQPAFFKASSFSLRSLVSAVSYVYHVVAVVLFFSYMVAVVLFFSCCMSSCRIYVLGTYRYSRGVGHCNVTKTANHVTISIGVSARFAIVQHM